MAAETLTSTQAASTVTARRSGGSGVMHCAFGTYSVASAALEDGDIFEMCKVPAHARIVGGYFYGDDLDTNATETLDIDIGWAANGGSGTYDAADPDGLGNLGVLTGDSFATGSVSPVAGLIYPFSGVLADGTCPNFTRETTIQLEVNAAAATMNAGSVSLCVYYIVESAAS